jgi:hypothetical protein
VSKSNEDSRSSQEHERLRELVDEIWDSAVYTDGQVAPSLAALRQWHWELWPDAPDAGRPRNSGAARRATKACRRLKRDLKKAFVPETELHRIAGPIAKFVIEMRTIEPFSRWGSRLECLAVHACCKFAGCPPPANMWDIRWSQAVMRGMDEELSKAERYAPLTNILIKRIRAAMATEETEG